MGMENYQKRCEMRHALEANSFRIANEIERAILTFIHISDSDVYPSKHLNEIQNHLEEKCKLLIPCYEASDITHAMVFSLNNRGLLGACVDLQLDSNLPRGHNTGYRIPDNSILKLLGV